MDAPEAQPREPDPPETSSTASEAAPVSDASSESESRSESESASEPDPEKAAPSEPESAAPQVPPRRARGIDRPLGLALLFLPAILLPLAHLPRFTERYAAALSYPFDLDAEEGFLHLQAVDLRLGNPIYRPLDEPPWLVGNYPPLYPWLVSRLIVPGRSGVPVSRLVAMMAAVASALALMQHLNFRTRRAIPTALGAVLFAATYEFHHWSAFARVDFPSLAFTGVGLAIFCNGSSRATTSLAALFFVAAAWCRQTAILAPVACLAAMAMHDRRRIPWFLIPWLGVGLGAYAWMNRATGGEFHRHLVLYNMNEMDWGAFRAVMKNEIWFFQRWAILAGLVGAVAIALSARAGEAPANESDARASEPARASDVEAVPAPAPRHPEDGLALGALAMRRLFGFDEIERNDPEEREPRVLVEDAPHARGVVGIYALLSAASLLAFAKVGSAPNYALEPLFAWALLVAESVARLMDRAGGTRRACRTLARAGLWAMALLLTMHAFRLHRLAPYAFGSRAPDAMDLEAGRALATELHRMPGEVAGEFPALALFAGKRPVIQPFILGRLAREGIWDETPFVEALREGRYSALLASEDFRLMGENGGARWTGAMARAALEGYRLQGIYVAPRPGGLRTIHYLWIPKPGGPGSGRVVDPAGGSDDGREETRGDRLLTEVRRAS